jgi:phosphatidylethanolamine-binding protein (PEBP) family uncharacterized protein
MNVRALARAGFALLFGVALAGCGSSGPPKPLEAAVPFASPALVHGAIPAAYTCDGRDVSPPLEWGAVPDDTGSLAVFALGLSPGASTGRYSVSIEWAVAGIPPALHRLLPGRLPHGAYAGRTARGRIGYRLCPPKGSSEHYQFALYGVPASLRIPRGFGGAELLRFLANPRPKWGVRVGGSFLASYTRRA